MNIALVGYGVEGQASYAYFARQGYAVTVCDQDESLQLPPEAQKQLGPEYLKELDRFDLVVRSAGINPSIILAENPGIEGKITTAINEFLKASPTKNIIGITGTKGKGTTSTLMSKMLEADNKRVYLGGNIGRSPMEFIHELTAEDWVVLELSSFQLCDLQYSPPIGICLMVVPEHLNWHTDMDDYILAKARLFEHQTPKDIAIYYAQSDISKKIAGYSPGLKIPYYMEPGAHVEDNKIVIARQAICATDEVKLLGEHNWQNVCAAITATWQVTQNTEAIRQVVTTFAGLEHRLEFVREFDEVRYYDDSFGTTPETATVAVKAFNQPKVVILGGSDKGTNYKELAHAISTSNVRSVILIGNTASSEHPTVAPKLETALKDAGFTNIVTLAKPDGSTMADIVAAARSAAQPGDVVLLSTGAASFDMFQNYKDRGNQFKSAVQALS